MGGLTFVLLGTRRYAKHSSYTVSFGWLSKVGPVRRLLKRPHGSKS